MRRHSGIIWPALVLLVLIAATIQILPEPAYAQPRWSFWADVSGVLYPGETHNVTVILRNTMCVERRQEIRFSYLHPVYGLLLRNLDGEQMEVLRERMDDDARRGVFRSYQILENQTGWVWRGDRQVLVSNVTVVLKDYCVYQSIWVERIRIWFPWSGYGRSLSSEVEVGLLLRGANVEEFPLSLLQFITPIPYHERPYDPYLNVSLPLSVPADVPSELLGKQGIVVEVDARTEGGLWTFGGPFGQPGVDVTGQVDVRPFRTFELLLTDSYGERPLPSARLRLQAHVYPFSLELQAGPDGRVQISRLPDRYSYRAYVLFQTAVVDEPITVAVIDADARELAAAGTLRAELYTVRVSVRDARNRPVQGAEVVLSPSEVIFAERWRPVSANTTEEGLAEFPLISRGNYSVSVRRLGVEVFSTWLYVGYHPTYGFREPEVEAVARLDDLIVSVVDGKGRPIAAQVEVEMASSGEVLASLTAPDGRLLLAQVPVTDYVIRVRANTSLGTELARELSARPGEGEGVNVRMPLFRVRLEARTADGRSLPEGTVTVDGAGFELTNGSVVLASVPEGTHRVSVLFRGFEVFTGELEVRDDSEAVLSTSVYRIELRFVDAEGNKAVVSWRLSGEGVEAEGSGDSLAVDFVPDVQLDLSLTYRFLNASAEVLRLTERAASLSTRGQLELPLARLRVSVAWDYGAPFSGTLTLTVGNTSLTGQVRNGQFATEVPLPFGEYAFRVTDGSGAVLSSSVVAHRGEAITVTIKTIRISVDVLDLLGTPVPGARVRVLRGTSPYRIGTTDQTGRVEFAGLPERLSPYAVEVTVRDHTELRVTSAPTVFTVPYVYLMGSLLSPLELGVIAGVLIAATAAVAIYSIRRSHL